MKNIQQSRQDLLEIINREQEKFRNSENPNERVNIIYNLISIKHNYKTIVYETKIYVDIKDLINNYVDLVKSNDFGYDLICSHKIFKVINYLNYKEQISILDYLFSAISREFPEIEKDWILDFRKKVQIKKILNDRDYKQFFKAIILYSCLDLKRLLLVLLVFVIAVTIILLPAPFKWMEIFKLNYENYSESFLTNHILNVISFFAGIKNELKLSAINCFGLIIQILGKIIFFLLIVNFIYKKISDKISIK